jgi:hypothetical protein
VETKWKTLRLRILSLLWNLVVHFQIWLVRMGIRHTLLEFPQWSMLPIVY